VHDNVDDLSVKMITVMIVWRIRVKIIRTILCCMCTTQLYTHTLTDFGLHLGVICVHFAFFLIRANLFMLYILCF